MQPDEYSLINIYPTYLFPRWKYDVFLSFAGKDTRLNFTDHLYDAFIRKGIRCFKDDVDLKRGRDIKEDLFQAIHDSLCAVLIISENYANSRWCLEELQEILESQKKFGCKVFPVFYGVDPSDVRHQRASFKKALDKHEKRFQQGKDNNKVQEWREALSQVSKLSGWDTRSRPETDVIRGIVKTIWNSKFSNAPSYGDNLVGLDSKMVELNSLLEIEADNEVRFVGIWGMRGVGKTTLARFVFEGISDHFHLSYFLGNVRDNSERKGLDSLEKDILSYFEYTRCLSELFCNRKVLLVLDDVSHVSQLEKLASPEWFWAGSRVIITTTDKHLLVSHGVYRIYKDEPMGKDESLKLFCKKAFKKDHPNDDYLALSETVVRYTGGVPLALITLGSFLYGRSLFEWEETLARMKQIPDEDIFHILKINYSGLNIEEKTIFLDIACFFNGWSRDEVTQILKNCGLHPTVGINVLIERALLTEKKALDGETTVLEVHDLLQELARSIVLQESPDHVHRRSRLWDLEDINEVLQNDKGSEVIQAIVLPFKLDGNIEIHHEAFSKMDNLKLLIISSELQLPNGLKCFCSALKVIQWRSYPLETLPIGTHRLDKLVEIQMPFSKIKHWNDLQLMKQLKIIDLSNSQHMAETPDFSIAPNLEKINLEGCSSLIAVHDSLGVLKKLVELNLSNCMNLEILPKILEMESLMKLDISWCNKLSVLPEFGECMNKLKLVNAEKTAIINLPKSLKFLTSLEQLYLSGPRELVLEMSVFNLKSLTVLDLSHCGISDESIPEDLGGLSSLITLYLIGNDFKKLPSACFSNLLQLLYLYLNGCRKLKSLPKLPPRLVRLYAMNCDKFKLLSSDRIWSLISPLDHEHRCRTHCEKRVLQPIQSGYVPEADFLVIVTREYKIPSWFPNTCFLSIKDDMFSDDIYRGSSEYEFEVEIPAHFRASKWCGLVACLNMQDKGMGNDKLFISWSCKSHENYYACKEWENEIFVGYEMKDHTCIMLLDFNEKTCWQYLTENNNRIHIKLSVCYKYSGYSDRLLKMECGWRILCQEEIQEWSNKLKVQHDSFHELSPQRHGSSPHKKYMQEWSNNLSSEEEHNSYLKLSLPREGSPHKEEMQEWGNKLAEEDHNSHHELSSTPIQGSSKKEEMQDNMLGKVDEHNSHQELSSTPIQGSSKIEEMQERDNMLGKVDEHNSHHELSSTPIQGSSKKEEMQERDNMLRKVDEHNSHHELSSTPIQGSSKKEEIQERDNVLGKVDEHNSHHELSSTPIQGSSKIEEMQERDNMLGKVNEQNSNRDEQPLIELGSCSNGENHGGRNVNDSGKNDSFERQERDKKTRFCSVFLWECYREVFRRCSDFSRKCYESCTKFSTICCSFSSKASYPCK